VCRLQQVFVFDTKHEQAERLAQELTDTLKIPATRTRDLDVAVRQSDVCVTCTPSRQPVLGPDHIRPGTFIAAVGADSPLKQELHPALMAKSKIVTDITEQSAVMGDLHHALDAGTVILSDVHAQLGEIVSGQKNGRESAEEIIVFDSTGMALQDVAAAALLYEKAQQASAGLHISLAA
jgi:alanine dehydrogenase